MKFYSKFSNYIKLKIYVRMSLRNKRQKIDCAIYLPHMWYFKNILYKDIMPSDKKNNEI